MCNVHKNKDVVQHTFYYFNAFHIAHRSNSNSQSQHFL